MRPLKLSTLLLVGLLSLIGFLVYQVPVAWILARVQPALPAPFSMLVFSQPEGTLWRGGLHINAREQVVAMQWDLAWLCLLKGQICLDVSLDLNALTASGASFVEARVAFPWMGSHEVCAFFPNSLPWLKIRDLNGGISADLMRWLPEGKQIQWTGEVMLESLNVMQTR